MASEKLENPFYAPESNIYDRRLRCPERRFAVKARWRICHEHIDLILRSEGERDDMDAGDSSTTAAVDEDGPRGVWGLRICTSVPIAGQFNLHLREGTKPDQTKRYSSFPRRRMSQAESGDHRTGRELRRGQPPESGRPRYRNRQDSFAVVVVFLLFLAAPHCGAAHGDRLLTAFRGQAYSPEWTFLLMEYRKHQSDPEAKKYPFLRVWSLLQHEIALFRLDEEKTAPFGRKSLKLARTSKKSSTAGAKTRK